MVPLLTYAQQLLELEKITRLGAGCAVAPAANPFASRLARRSSTLANDVSYDNAYLSVWR